MEIKKAEFIISSPNLAKCPELNRPEFAFIGRSNVGKSSLINMLVNHKNLAQTSAKPGKTQLINHFQINSDWYMVDLPGYGYARVGKEQRLSFVKMTRDYLEKRENLHIIFQLIDSRHEPQKIDIDFTNYLGAQGIPCALIFTKADKQSISKGRKNMDLYRKELQKNWEAVPDMLLTSATDAYGKEDVLNYLSELLKAAQS